MTDLDRHQAFLEALATVGGARRENEAYELAFCSGVAVAEARDAIQAATEILEWRFGCAPEWRVLRFAQALIDDDRKRQGDLFTMREG
jgi:hypothetical protein